MKRLLDQSIKLWYNITWTLVKLVDYFQIWVIPFNPSGLLGDLLLGCETDYGTQQAHME